MKLKLNKSSIDEEKKILYSVVLEPETEVTEEGDAHGHVISAEEIENSAHGYMMRGAKVKIMHKGKPVKGLIVVESFIAPVDYKVGNQFIKKGSWIIAIKVLIDKIWELIKSGEIGGVSPGGKAIITEE